MLIYFLTKEPDVCQLISDKLITKEIIITIFPTTTNLFKKIFELNLIPDLLLLDYLYFQPDLFNPYNLFNKSKKKFPIIFYNHPFPLPRRRKIFWLYNLKKTKEDFDLTNISKILYKLEQILLDKNISKYISCIQYPEKYISTNTRYIEPLNNEEISYYLNNYDNVITKELTKDKKFTSQKKIHQESKEENEFLDLIRTENKLSHNLFIIFEYLYLHKESHVSTLELRNLLNHTLSENGLRLIIYRLRKVLTENKKYNLTIETFDYGYILKSIN